MSELDNIHDDQINDTEYQKHLEHLQHLQHLSTNSYWLKLSGQALTVFLTIVLSMSGFWMLIGRDFATRNEVNTIVNQKIEWVQSEIRLTQVQNDKIGNIIKENTKIINELKIQMAVLNKTLEFNNGK